MEMKTSYSNANSNIKMSLQNSNQNSNSNLSENKKESSMKEFFDKSTFNQKVKFDETPIEHSSYLWKSDFSSVSKPELKGNDQFVLVEIEIIYKEQEKMTSNNYTNNSAFSDNNINIIDNYISKSEKDLVNYFENQDQNNEEYKNYHPLETFRHSARVYVPLSKVSGTFIEQELKKTNDNKNYLKIELRAKRNKVMIESILNCFEYLSNKNFEFHFTKENLISYFYAFSLCQLNEKRKEVLERLLHDLTDDNIVYFLKVVSTIDDEFLQSYSFWLIRYLISKNEKLDLIKFNGYNFSSIVKISNGVSFNFDDNRIIFNNYRKGVYNVSANLNFLRKYFDTIYKPDIEKYFKVNDYFNMGKVLRRKSDDNLVDDYPHYYQLVLENDPSIVLYAIRPSENGNFIISKSIDDFSKYGINYVAEVVPNFWGTYFDLYDNGYEKSLYDKTPKVISKPREKIGAIHYETNIMGECPRYFKLDIIHNKQIHKLENLKPEWNEDMDCYCLNFYGRVKKASAKNFQICYPDDQDNIILQHGKVSRDEFNIDFREPFNFIFAFAVSLVAIGKKRVVS